MKGRVGTALALISRLDISLEDDIMAQMLTVPRTEWTAFFNRFGKSLLGKRAEVEVASLDLGDQIVAEWIPMLGITYDYKNDVLDVALDRIDHLIQHPREIVVEEGPDGLSSVAVVDGEGARQVVRLKDPLMLPPIVPAK